MVLVYHVKLHLGLNVLLINDSFVLIQVLNLHGLALVFLVHLHYFNLQLRYLWKFLVNDCLFVKDGLAHDLPIVLEQVNLLTLSVNLLMKFVFDYHVLLP